MLKKITAISPSGGAGLYPFCVTVTHGNEPGTYSGVLVSKYPTAQHPEISWIQRSFFEFFQSKDVIVPGTVEAKKFEKSVFSHLAGFTCPTDSKESVLATAIHIGWLFLLDNVVDAKNSVFRQQESLFPELAAHLKDAMRSAVLKRRPSQTAGIEVTEKLASYAKLIHLNFDIGRQLSESGRRPTQYFVQHHDKYLQALINESNNRKSGIWMTPDSYKELRKYSSAVEEVLEFIWVQRGLHLDDDLRTNINFMGMIQAANSHVSYVNDLFSLNNEIAEDTRENIVRVIQYRSKCSLADAINQAIILINEAMEQFDISKVLFIKYCDDRDRDIGLEAISYAERLMTGNLEWSKLTGRYKEAESTVSV